MYHMLHARAAAVAYCFSRFSLIPSLMLSASEVRRMFGNLDTSASCDHSGASIVKQRLVLSGYARGTVSVDSRNARGSAG